jgi:hypothetical protein
MHPQRKTQLGNLARLMVKHGAPTADSEFLQTVLTALLKCNGTGNRELGPMSQVDLTSSLSRELRATEQDFCLGNYTIGTTPESSSWKATDWFPEYAGRAAIPGWSRVEVDSISILINVQVGIAIAVGCQVM